MNETITESAAERRRRFLGRVGAALGRTAGDAFSYAEAPDAAARAALEAAGSRSAGERLALLERLSAAAGPLRIRLEACPTAEAAGNAVEESVRSGEPEWGSSRSVCAWRHPLVEALGLTGRLSAAGIPVHLAPADPDETARRRFREAAAAAHAGVTAADFCVADTATLVIKDRPGRPRSASLLPSLHVAVIRLSRVVADLKELYAMLRWDPVHRAEGLLHCTTFVTGPSKTADIEATLVHGAHGPRALHLFVITGDG